MNKRKIQIFSSIDYLANNLSELIIKGVNELPNGNYFTIALSGGSTPKIIFEYIAKNIGNKINWKKIKIFWSDERCVPPDNNESNYKMVYDSLLKYITIPNENIFRIFGEAEPEKEAKRYSVIIKENVPLKNDIPQFDLVLLGLGEDGHTVSIFPNQISTFYSDEFCIVTINPYSNQNRITVSGKIINNAKRAIFLVTGANKSSIVNRILGNKKNENILPAELVSLSKGELIWMLDTASAQLLDSQIQNTGIIR